MLPLEMNIQILNYFTLRELRDFAHISGFFKLAVSALFYDENSIVWKTEFCLRFPDIFKK